MTMSHVLTTQAAHEALRAAGYRSHGEITGPFDRGAILWQRRVREGVYLNVLEWPPSPGLRTEPSYELDMRVHDDVDALHVKLFGFRAEQIIRDLPALEARLLGAVRAAMPAMLGDGSPVHADAKEG
jgi:hypothetical protein